MLNCFKKQKNPLGAPFAGLYEGTRRIKTTLQDISQAARVQNLVH